MYEWLQRQHRRLGGAGLLAVLVLCMVMPVSAVATGVGPAGTSARMLVPVGHTVGIKLFARGVMVVKLAEGGTPAKECGLQTGDVIVRCGGIMVTSTEQFRTLLQRNGEQETDLQVHRDGKKMVLSIAPEETAQGSYSIGAWIRDSMAGIGTVTYYDPTSGGFGALGHGIADVDTAQLMPFSAGSILPSRVKAVQKGTAGTAGELKGEFDLQTNLGTLYANTNSGVFGTLAQGVQMGGAQECMPVAERGEIHLGPAVIRTNIRGDEVRQYQVEIQRVKLDAKDGRELELRVTDPELIAVTGGIVQGMSGSPIIQDGKLVGAVTHVLLNDSTRGYGISIETMLNAAG